MATREARDRLTCESKVRYAKLKSAEKALRAAQQRYGVGAKDMRPYKCAVCSAYHLGHPRGRKTRLGKELKAALSTPGVSLIKDDPPDALTLQQSLE